jgi:hypothetical protein
VAEHERAAVQLADPAVMRTVMLAVLLLAMPAAAQETL